MKALISIALLLTFVSNISAEEIETRFLFPERLIFEARFNDDDDPPAKPNWMLRKSTWEIEEGLLVGRNAGGNGAFIRLHSKKEKGGVLPQDYIMKFSFKIEENPEIKRPNKYHKKYSAGHRFSLDHYTAGYRWNPANGFVTGIGHGKALQDESFQIEKGKWYHATVEIRGDEILGWFDNGPAFFMQHESFRSKSNGWEFFVHASEVGFLDNLQVWSVKEGQKDGWKEFKEQLAADKRSFLSSEHPDFKTTKDKAE